MRKVISIAIWLTAVACGRERPAAFRDIVRFSEHPDNGLRRRVHIGDWVYTIQYKPHRYIWEKEGINDDSTLRVRRDQLKGTAWFNISFRVSESFQSPLRYGLAEGADYAARLQYFVNDAPADIWLLYGTDTLHVAAYGFDNNYNLTPHETMVVGFVLPTGEDEPSRDMQLTYYDRVFGNGLIKATIRKEKLKAIPN